MSTPEHCTVERVGRILVITINRPERMNAVHPPANFELQEVFDEFGADKDMWVAILTGAGDRAFCAGNDLRWQAEGRKVTTPPRGYGGLTSRFDLNKPVIAAVNGVAFGGGFEIALACDIVIAAQSATFALPEPKVGLAALAGGVHRLARQIPLKHAMGMILTGRSVNAEEGRMLGFVNAVVPDADLMTEAVRWAEQIIVCSPLSVRASKSLVQQSLKEPDLASAMERQLSNDALRDLLRSEDLREGARAFVEKRKPNWSAA